MFDGDQLQVNYRVKVNAIFPRTKNVKFAHTLPAPQDEVLFVVKNRIVALGAPAETPNCV